MVLLQVSGVHKVNERGFELKDVSFSQQWYQQIAIAGETGSGKSTLLKIIAGLAQPDSGEVIYDGKKVIGPADQLIPGHPKIAYLSQQFELPHYLRVEQVLEYANKLTKRSADQLFEICRITHLLKRRTDQLSGGEQQRIAIARLLIGSPGLLLLDEPYSNTDMIHKQLLKAIIGDIAEQLKISIIMVSHDPVDSLSWADEILLMRDGRIIQHGMPKEVYRHPVDNYAAGLLGKYNVWEDKNGVQRIVRPEDLVLSRKHISDVKGTVQNIIFCGSYYDVEVYTETRMFTSRMMNLTIEEGDIVTVSPAEALK
ncbi:MAG: ABC transporter ATP-binding protein [Chitinophagaceae bacterium]|nr:ABC transporter ATP-binding protein [Chitinophagaceae bacterium]